MGAPRSWRPASWLSWEAVAWYLLVLLLLAVFGAPFRSVLHSGQGEGPSWGEYEGQVPEIIDWNLLGELNLADASLTPGLASVDGQVVALPGYLVPLDDDLERATEFLLVPYFGACIHVPPPAENQMVHVRMRGQRKVEVLGYGWDPTWVIGRFHVKGSDSPFGSAAFQLEGFDTQRYLPNEDAREESR